MRERYYGRVDFDTKIIEINLLTKLSPAQVYFHELLHLKYPDAPEKEILKRERDGWKKMTIKQRLKLYRQLFR